MLRYLPILLIAFLFSSPSFAQEPAAQKLRLSIDKVVSSDSMNFLSKKKLLKLKKFTVNNSSAEIRAITIYYGSMDYKVDGCTGNKVCKELKEIFKKSKKGDILTFSVGLFETGTNNGIDCPGLSITVK